MRKNKCGISLLDEPGVIGLWVLAILVLCCIIVALWLAIGYATRSIAAWDMAVRIAALGLIGSACYPYINKKLSEKLEVSKLTFAKRVETYEAVSKYLFKWQKRTGYVPPKDLEKKQQELMEVNRLVNLWASDDVLKCWQGYIEGQMSVTPKHLWKKQQIIACLFRVMRDEAMGRDVDLRRFTMDELTLWYGSRHFVIGSDEAGGLI